MRAAATRLARGACTALLSIALAMGLAACGGGGQNPPPPSAGSATIGPGGAVYAWGQADYRGCAVGSSGCTSSTAVPTLVLLP